MSRHLLLPCAAAALFVFTITAPGLDSEELQNRIDKARSEADQGQYQKADAILDEALKGAKEAGNDHDAAAVTLAQAFMLRSRISNQDDDGKKSQLPKLYNFVIAKGKGADKAVACNNLGVFYLHEGKYDEAVKSFDLAADEPPPDAYAFYYNYGRALEKVEKAPTKALEKYWKSIEQRPGYYPAAHAAAALLAKATDYPKRDEEAGRLLLFYDSDKAMGANDLLGPLVYEMMPRWGDAKGDAEGVRRMLPFLASHLARSRVDQQHFAALYGLKPKGAPEEEGVRGADLQPLREVVGAAEPLKELAAIYLNDDFAVKADSLVLTRQEVQEALPAWEALITKAAEPDRTRKNLATLLTLAGGSFERQAQAGGSGEAEAAGRALKRYTASYALNPIAVDPALRAVSILADHSQTVDPTGNLLDKYTRELFSQKGNLLLHAETRDDHVRLQSLHIVLATVYERQKRWDGDAQSAAFQWQAAIKDEDDLRKLDPSYPVSPDLGYRLAEALVNAKTELAAKEAAPRYLKAMKGFLTVGNPSRSAEIYGRVQELIKKKVLSFDDAEAPARLGALAERSASALLKWELEQPDGVRAVALSNNGDMLVLGRQRRMVAFALGSERPEPVGPIEERLWEGYGLAWMPKAMVFVRGEGEAVEWWNAPSFTPSAKPLARHEGAVVDVAVAAAEGGLIASLGAKGEAKIWSVAKREEVRTIRPPGVPSRRLALSPDGKYLALGGRNVVTLWEVSSGEKVREKETPGDVVSIAISADGALLAAGLSTGTVVWSGVAKDGEWRPLTGPAGAVTSLCFAPHGPYLVAVHSDVVRLWDVKKSTEAAWFGGPLPPRTARFSADGRSLAVGFGWPPAENRPGRGLVRIWTVDKFAGD
jgi:tetratricopeptide (TPR) repeat protein